MPLRRPIGEVLANALRGIQANGAQLTAGAVKSWMAAHRDELLATIQQAQTERGAQLLRQLCREVPLAAGLVQLAMGSSVDMAIATIGIHDATLADELRKHRANVIKLQEYWRLGAAGETR